MEVLTYPSLFFWSRGRFSDFAGNKFKKDHIVKFVAEKSRPPSKKVNCAEMQFIEKEVKLALIYFGDLNEDLFKTFMNMTEDKYLVQYYNYLFFHTTDVNCATRFGASGNSIAVFRDFDESPVHYTGGATEEELTAFCKASSIPKLIKFGPDYVEHIFGESNSALILFTEE